MRENAGLKARRLLTEGRLTIRPIGRDFIVSSSLVVSWGGPPRTHPVAAKTTVTMTNEAASRSRLLMRSAGLADEHAREPATVHLPIETLCRRTSRRQRRWRRGRAGFRRCPGLQAVSGRTSEFNSPRPPTGLAALTLVGSIARYALLEEPPMSTFVIVPGALVPMVLGLGSDTCPYLLDGCSGTVDLLALVAG
jgi:hypothetical protein